MTDEVDAQVRDFIAGEYANELAACRALLDFGTRAFQNWSSRPIKRGADRIIVAEGARAAKTYSAIVDLCETGYGEQALMLNRSLFEGMAIARWVPYNRREAVRLFSRHARFSSVLWRETFDRLGWLSDTDHASWPRVGPKERGALEDLFGQYGTKPWVTKSLPKLLDAIQDQWSDGGDGLFLFHDVSHRYSNQILHSTATALGATTSERTSETLSLWVGPSSAFIPQALFAAHWIYGQVLTLLIDVFLVSSRADFDAVYRPGHAVFVSKEAQEDAET